MHKVKIFLGVALVACVAIGVVYATGPKVDFAEALSKTMLPKEQYEQMINAIVQTGRGMAQAKAQQENLQLDPETHQAKLEKSLRAKFSYDYFIGMNAKTMKKNFNDKELKQILAFYDTPQGKKWNKHTPEIISETLTAVRGDLEKELPVMIDALVKK